MGLSYYPEGAIIAGKPRVYLCLADADHERMFKHNADLLIGACPNAVIWYFDRNSSGKRGDEDYLLKLADMQLFVLPVTASVIDGEKTVMDELRLAAEHHIPILPLMQDGISSRDFAKILPGAHCLNEYKNEVSTVTFTDKLKSFLDQTLTGDEEAEKIHSFIKDYFFISYRKKDRASAISVMKRIHEYDHLWDVGLWYDEFLVPGENYHEGIEEALKKSCADVMVITPNTVEPDNYIIKTEYPRANELGSCIIPVLVKETPDDELKNAFEGLPEVITLNDQSLGDILGGVLKSTPDGSERETPQRLYYIGLSYLKGIDMERDIRKGMLLLKRSAESGYPDAYERLVRIFLYGTGIGVDIRGALSWQKAYLSKLKNDMSDAPSVSRITKYLDELFRLVDIFLDLLTSENAPVISIGDDENTRGMEEKHKHDREIIKNAGIYLSSSIKYLDLIKDDKETYMRYLARCSEAETRLERSDFNKRAYDSCKNAIILRERLNDSSEKGKLELANDYFTMGQMYVSDCYVEHMAGRKPDRNAAEEAQYYLAKALLLYEDILKENDSVENKRVKISLNLQLATVYEMLDDGKLEDDVKRAKVLVDEATNMQEIVFIQTDASEDLMELGSAYYHLGSFPQNMPGTKIMYLEKAVDCYSRLYQRTGRFFHQMNLKSAEGLLERLKAMTPDTEDDAGKP
ncbi:MAG: TIR domain-containing protein [Lachnospiraceae bacterium]|nr:TIR domain-containing protein [Lachnospiraceae bacterium]